MSRLTMLDKVVGHYAEVGTEEATEFLKLCSQLELGWKWCNGDSVNSIKPTSPYVCVYDDRENTLLQETPPNNPSGNKLKPFTLRQTPAMINVPFGAELCVSVSGSIVMWFKKSEGVILQCNAPKSNYVPQYPFWGVSKYPSLEVLDAAFGSSLKCIHNLGEEGVDWVEMK